MNDSINYNIKRDENGCEIFKATVEWTDERGNIQKIESYDIDECLNILLLLNGEITIADLMP